LLADGLTPSKRKDTRASPTKKPREGWNEREKGVCRKCLQEALSYFVPITAKNTKRINDAHRSRSAICYTLDFCRAAPVKSKNPAAATTARYLTECTKCT
jgi:hypothetical protein